MDTDLQNLVDLLRKRGFTVASCDPEQRIQVTNPVSSLMAEEIALKDGGYYTGFGYEVGEKGRETDCADRIAYMLGVTSTPQEAGP